MTTKKSSGAEEQDKLWKKLRAQNVGGSEVAALYDQHPYGLTKFELWHQKKGILPPLDLSKNERVMGGVHLEAGIAAWASQKWEDMPLTKADVYVTHPTVKGFGCTPDYFITGTHIPVQIKKVSTPIFMGKFDYTGEIINDAPLGYLLQVQQELACLEQEFGWLLVCIGGDSLARMKVQRNDGIVNSLQEKVAEFWASIEALQPPEPNYEQDRATIAALRTKGKNRTVFDKTGDTEFTELCQLYLQAHEWAEGWKKEKAGLNARILQLCDAQNIVMCGQYKVNISDIPSSPEKNLEITAEMVGTTVNLSKGRKGSTRLSVVDTLAVDKKNENEED